MTDPPKSAQVSDTSANSQQASYLVDTYFGSLFTDALQIKLHIAISGNQQKKDYLRNIQVQKSAHIVTRAS